MNNYRHMENPRTSWKIIIFRARFKVTFPEKEMEQSETNQLVPLFVLLIKVNVHSLYYFDWSHEYKMHFWSSHKMKHPYKSGNITLKKVFVQENMWRLYFVNYWKLWTFSNFWVRTDDMAKCTQVVEFEANKKARVSGFDCHMDHCKVGFLTSS